MLWRETKNLNDDDCYFCTCSVKGFDFKSKKEMSYTNSPSAIRSPPDPLRTFPSRF